MKWNNNVKCNNCGRRAREKNGVRVCNNKKCLFIETESIKVWPVTGQSFEVLPIRNEDQK